MYRSDIIPKINSSILSNKHLEHYMGRSEGGGSGGGGSGGGGSGGGEKEEG